MLRARYASIIIVSFVSLTTVAQDVIKDSKGDDVFSSLEGKSFKATISSGDNNLSLNNLFQYGSATRYFVGNHQFTVQKSNNISVTGKLFSKTKDVRLSDGTSLKKAGSVEIGYVRAIDSIISMSALPRSTFSLGLFLGASLDNESVYDTVSKKENIKKPATIYGRLVANIFFKSYTLISGSVKISNRNNLSDLPEYLTDPLYNQNNIVGFTEKKGRLGEVFNNNEARIRLSANQLFQNTRFMIGGYYIAKIRESFLPVHMIGANIFISTTTFGDNNLRVSEGFAINFEWTRDADEKKFSEPTIFVSGTLNIKAIITSVTPKLHPATGLFRSW